MNREPNRSKDKQRNTFLFQVLTLMAAALIVLHFGKVMGVIGKGVDIIGPFIVGLGIAYIWNLLLEPIESRLFDRNPNPKRQKIRRPVSVLLSLFIILGILALVLYLVIPQLYNSFRIIATAVPVLVQDWKNWFLEITEGVDWTQEIRESIEGLNINWNEVGSRVAEFLRSGVGGFVGSTMHVVGNISGFFVSSFTALFFAVYLLFGKEKLSEQLGQISRAYGYESRTQKARYVLDILHETFANYFKGQVLDAFAVGLLLMIAMLLLRIPYAVTIGVVVMVTSLIPMIGALIGGAIGFLMIAVQSGQQAALFIIVLFVVQQIEGNYIYPKIVGDSVGLPGIWMFCAVIIGGAVGGPLGMIIGVPLAGALYKMLRNDVNERIAQNSEITKY